MKRNQWAPVLLAVLLFVSGAFVGAMGHRYYTATVVSAKTDSHTSEDFRRRYVAEMQTRLKLTSSQLSQLQNILDQTKAKYKTVRDSYHPEMVKIKNDQISQVKMILTPEQVPEYEKLVAEREQRAKEQEERERHEEHQQRVQPPTPTQ